jgi:hypothetical protein
MHWKLRGYLSAWVGEGSPKQKKGKTNHRIRSSVEDGSPQKDPQTVSWLRATSTIRRGIWGRRRNLRHHPEKDGDEKHEEKQSPDKHPKAAGS